MTERWDKGERGMGRGSERERRKREVPKLPSPAEGLAGTIAGLWVEGWFWASLTLPLSFL